MRLPQIRKEHGDAAARAAITEALATHGTVLAAATALGVRAHTLRRTAKAVGLVLVHDRRGSPKGSPAYERRWGSSARAAKAAVA